MKSQGRITGFEGLYGEKGPRPAGEYLFSELLETRSQHFDWNIRPHFHPTLYQLFFIAHGKFELLTADEGRQLEGPCLVFIPPTALHGFRYEPHVKGRILTMSDKLVDTLLPPSELVTQLLGSIQCLSAFPEPYTPERVTALITTIDKELFSNEAEKNVMLRACLQQLLLITGRLSQEANTCRTAADVASFRYFRQLQQRLRQAGAPHSVAKLAEELGITPVHLNRICKDIAGKSAGQLVQDHLLEEARKYLTYTSYSVSEIAYHLNFEYPNYFARFFRKHTGLSPKEFRNRKE